MEVMLSWMTPNTLLQDRFGDVFLADGIHSLELVFFERAGGAGLELFAQQGIFTSFNAGFELVGDTANGGLEASIPEPQTYAMFATILVGAAFMTVRKHRKTKEEENAVAASA